MVHHWSLFLFFLCFSMSATAQDERFIRQILTDDLHNEPEATPSIPVFTQFSVKGASYRVDLNGDGIEETIQPQKRDGVDWLEVRDASERVVYETKLVAMGAESSIYKIKLVYLSKSVRTLIIFLDEGLTQGKRVESQAQIYLLSYENNDLKTLKLTPGPHYFHEKEAQRDQYWRRNYSVNVYDIDQDGTREIAVQFNHIQRIFRYLGNGEWLKY